MQTALSTFVDELRTIGVGVSVGEHLDAALSSMNTLGRVPVCGMISGYNEAGSRTSVRNLSNIIYGRITLRGFTAADFMDLRPQFLSDMAGWLREGRSPTVFIHTPDNVDALELARRFHDDVRARVPEVEPLSEPIPAGPPTLF